MTIMESRSVVVWSWTEVGIHGKWAQVVFLGGDGHILKLGYGEGCIFCKLTKMHCVVLKMGELYGMQINT